MAKSKACKACRTIYEGAKCPACGSAEGVEGFKGKVIVLHPEQSEIAQNLTLKQKGTFAARLR